MLGGPDGLSGRVGLLPRSHPQPMVALVRIAPVVVSAGRVEHWGRCLGTDRRIAQKLEELETDDIDVQPFELGA